MTRPKHFEICFPRTHWNDRIFRNYVKLVSGGSATPTAQTPEKHHIVPREWLTWNDAAFNFDTEDKNNVIYLSVRDKLIAMLFLAIIFKDLEDGTTYRNICDAIGRRYHLQKFQVWQDPYKYFSRTWLDFLADRRVKDNMNKKPNLKKNLTNP